MAAEGYKHLYIIAVSGPVEVHGTFPGSGCAVRVIPAQATESANYYLSYAGPVREEPAIATALTARDFGGSFRARQLTDGCQR